MKYLIAYPEANEKNCRIDLSGQWSLVYSKLCERLYRLEGVGSMLQDFPVIIIGRTKSAKWEVIIPEVEKVLIDLGISKIEGK